MPKIQLNLSNLSACFPEGMNAELKAKAQTLFLQKASLFMHRYYGGKMQTLPKAGVWGTNWFNIWYTPGVSKISTSIRDNAALSYELSNRGNLVAVVSDSTRVLGDGDCSPFGGLGVMEGKAYLMKYLGGVDAVALCVNNRRKDGSPDPDKLIDFVKMIEPSFGAVNLEDISQPNCYRVLDELRNDCNIPVWHDDAQGTASVTLAGLINALKVADKAIGDVSIVMMGAGAANSTIAKFLLLSGANPERMILFDVNGALDKNREDIEQDRGSYKQWELCLQTNPKCVQDIETALTGADVLIALSKPGPDTVKPSWISKMAEKAIVFTCANPVPEIYPYAAKEAGAYIVATGRGDFPNQVNNSLGFPGILKGALLAQAAKITDNMAIQAAIALADYAEKKGITPEYIISSMDERDVFPQEAMAVAMQAVSDGVARNILTPEEYFTRAKTDIDQAQQAIRILQDGGMIETPPMEAIQEIFEQVVKEVLV